MLRKISALVLALTILLTTFGCSTKTTETDNSSKADVSTTGSDVSSDTGTTSTEDTSTEDTAQGGVLRIVTAGKGSGIGFPAGYTGYYERIYSDPALESLARIAEDKTSVEPWLAEDISIDADALTMVVTLREGISFSDGTPFNAEAVIKNWNYYIENGSNRFNNVESFEATGEYEVTAKLTEYDNSTILNTCVEGGWMISPPSLKKTGKTWFTPLPWALAPSCASAATWTAKSSMRKTKTTGRKANPIWTASPLPCAPILPLP